MPKSWNILGDSFEQGNGILSITQKLNFVENIFQKLNNFEIGEYSINFFAISVLWLGGTGPPRRALCIKSLNWLRSARRKKKEMRKNLWPLSLLSPRRLSLSQTWQIAHNNVLFLQSPKNAAHGLETRRTWRTARSRGARTDGRTDAAVAAAALTSFVGWQ